MANYPDLKGKIVLLTGGANGIGKATVSAFAAQNARVYFCDKDKDAGRTLAHSLPGTTFQALDLRKETQTLKWLREVRNKAGRVDILVNNAAVDPRIPLSEMTLDRLDDLLAINLKWMFLTARECAPHMAEGSSIINFSSITFHIAPAMMSGYVATKAAIIGFTRSLARELGPGGIRVNTLSPGWIMTDRQLREFVDAKTKKLIKRSQCIPKLIQPDDIAQVVLFLASNASSAITGQEILADRGWAHS